MLYSLHQTTQPHKVPVLFSKHNFLGELTPG